MSKPVCYMGIYNEHDIRDMHTVVVRYVTDFKSNPDRVIPLYEHPPVPTTERRVPDRAEFERQAKYQGVTDFSLNQDGFRTYANDIAEMAWRLWANKGNAAPTKSRSTLAEEYEKGLSICEAEYRKLQGEYDRLAEALETEKRFTARCDEIERELEGQKKANGFLALKAQAGEPDFYVRRRPSPGYEVVSSSDPMAQPAYLHSTTERRVITLKELVEASLRNALNEGDSK